MDARHAVMHYKYKGDRVDEVLRSVVLNHICRLEVENKRLRKALGTIVHEIDEALEHFVEENTLTEIRTIAQEALGWEVD